ncbi:MAG: SIMPL domain-containing protein [Candidatus Zixiibacteriota bacterium]
MNKLVFTIALIATLAASLPAAAETFSFTIPDVYLKEGGAAKEPVLLNVTGTGRVKTVPDQVLISARIYTENKKAGEAFDENQFKVRYLIDKLVPTGVPREKIATESLSIYPIYKENSSKVDKYVVDRSIKIFQDDMDRISPILDALIDSQIEDIGNIQFIVKDLDQKYEEALEEAANDCRRRAKVLAAGMGAKIVDMKSMSYSMGGGDYGRMEREMSEISLGMRGGAMDEFNQVIVPREVTTTVTVNATYEVVYVAD